MRFDFRSQATRFFTVLQTHVQTKVSTVRTAAKQFLITLQAKAGSTQSALILALQTGFRALRLRLSALTKLNPQSMLLRLLALAAAALLTVLAIGGIQTIARETWSGEIADERTEPASPAADSPPKTWAGLPTAPALEPDKPAETKAKTPAAKASPAKTPQPKPSEAKAQPKPSASAPPKATPQPQAQPEPTSPVPLAILQSNLSALAPRQEAALAHPTNYGDRYAKDIFGKPLENAPLVVLHETVGTADSAINTVRTPHYNEDDQTSYHSIIRLDGTIVYVVPPEKRAFGAGNSIFKTAKGTETVKTHKAFPPSVNNFAYHISLETPADGHNNAQTHSGYTDAQYRSLAWLVAHTSVTDDRVTTHRAIDQSGSRIDPRSFDATRFYSYLRALPRPGLTQPG
jgi:hypothetical protein